MMQSLAELREFVRPSLFESDKKKVMKTYAFEVEPQRKGSRNGWSIV